MCNQAKCVFVFKLKIFCIQAKIFGVFKLNFWCIQAKFLGVIRLGVLEVMSEGVLTTPQAADWGDLFLVANGAKLGVTWL